MDGVTIVKAVFGWLESLVRGFADIWPYLSTGAASIWGASVSPLTLLTAGGLSVFLGYAIFKWLIP